MSVLNKFERKLNARGAARTEKQFTLFISNGDVDDDIIIIVQSLEKSGLLIEGAMKQ